MMLRLLAPAPGPIRRLTTNEAAAFNHRLSETAAVVPISIPLLDLPLIQMVPEIKPLQRPIETTKDINMYFIRVDISSPFYVTQLKRFRVNFRLAG